MNQSTQLPSDNLIQLLFALPPQLISFLVICSKPIHLLSQLSLIIQWSHPLGPYPSWILLFTYAFSILFSHLILYYAIPNLICLSIISINLFRQQQQQQQTKIINHPSKHSLSSHPIALLDSLQSFQILADHVSIISSHLNPIYQIFICSDPQRSTQALRTCLTSIPFSVIITYLIPPKFLFLFIGSILIVWSSKWFQLLINLLWKSLLLRFSLNLLIDLSLHARFHPITLLHQLDPSLQNKNLTHSFYEALSYLRALLKFNSPNIRSNDRSDASYSLDPSQDIEFCLTIFENQRWWMGLDWTSNLLPHERPNWSDSLNHAVPSPANITLPSPKTFKDVTQNLQRRVEWKWIDSDWKIIEAHNSSKEDDQSNQADETLKSNSNSITTTEKSTGSTSNQTSPNTSFRRHQNRSSASYSGSSACLSACLDSEIIDESLRASGLNASIVGAYDPTKPWDVDANGWQYGGNHWEKMSKKSGIGKYTRRRAWSRKACLMTRLEPLELNLSSSKDVSSIDSPLFPPPPTTIPPSESDSHSVSTLLDQTPSQSSNAIIISPVTTTSSVSSLKSKKSFGLLRRKK